ncbi:MAG: hypothetical protein H5T69_07085 [Chloroflexi bacterium]|nr:hypothetical protein [Chloroflexota bacterium]
MRIISGSVRHLAVPIAQPVKTAFGAMHDRHAVLLLLEDEAGHIGVGESWVNFPLWAPWERVAALERGLMPWLIGREVPDVAAIAQAAYRAFLGPAQQSGTVGPLLSALCAVELALWDLWAQAQDLPLAYALWDKPKQRVRVYASGINHPIPWELIDEHLARGVELFKLKMGFGDEIDRRNLEELADHLAGQGRIAIDVNRGWTLAQAHDWLEILAAYGVQWLEEPLRIEEEERLPELRARNLLPLAGGENIMLPPGEGPDRLIHSPFDVLQPDLTKYASPSSVRRAVEPAQAADKRLILHFLGSAPGGAASLHFSAGLSEGLLEWDVNRNPLRTDLYLEPFEIVEGCITLPERPGLGWALREEVRRG